MKILNTILTVSVLVTALGCSDFDSDSSVKEAWDEKNDPARLLSQQEGYISKFSDLKLSGSLTEIPWSGDYWPTYKGGISYRWQTREFGYDLDVNLESNTTQLSPAEKYDIFVGNYDFPLVRLERARTRIMSTIEGSDEYDPDFKIPTWEGLCHGWAPATTLFKEPNPVVLKGRNGVEVSFGTSDIKALLTYYQQYNKNGGTTTHFAANRCSVDFGELRTKLSNDEITQEEYDNAINSIECRDTNAGTFHLILTNQITVLDEGFVADVTRDTEVWNQAVYKYNSRIVSEETDAANFDKNAAEGTVKEVRLKTTMYYTTEISHHWNGNQPRSQSEAKKHYDYKLELNSDGEIIGGSWVSEERPDFLWKESMPKFKGYLKALGYIYEKSIEE